MKRWPACATPVLVATLLLGACGDDDTDTRVPNPASEFCEERGGTVEIEEDAAGNQVGICVLSDGTRIDEWEYYREEATTTPLHQPGQIRDFAGANDNGRGSVTHRYRRMCHCVRRGLGTQ